MEIIKILNDLTEALLAKKFRVEALFNNGVNISYLSEIMGDAPIALNEELVELYNWHNGSPFSPENSVDYTLFCRSILTPFEYSWLSYRYFNSDTFFENKKDHFPIMQNGGGVFLFYDNGINSKTKGMIFEYDISSPPNIYKLKFESIKSLLEGTLSCVVMDIYKVNSKNDIEVDFKREREIFQQFNPSLEYWQK